MNEGCKTPRKTKGMRYRTQVEGNFSGDNSSSLPEEKEARMSVCVLMLM